MLKLIGAIMILLCTTYLGSRKIFEFYYTYSFLNKTIGIIRKIGFERNSNLIYEKIFKKIDFSKDIYIEELQKNIYTNQDIKNIVQDFFYNLGKKNKAVEDELITCFLSELLEYKAEYYQKYIQNKKLYILYGFSLGLFLIIILI